MVNVMKYLKGNSITLDDDTLYIIDRRCKELSGYTLKQIVSYAMFEEYKPDRKKKLRTFMQASRKARLGRHYTDKRAEPSVKRTDYYGS